MLKTTHTDILLLLEILKKYGFAMNKSAAVDKFKIQVTQNPESIPIIARMIIEIKANKKPELKYSPEMTNGTNLKSIRTS